MRRGPSGRGVLAAISIASAVSLACAQRGLAASADSTKVTDLLARAAQANEAKQFAAAESLATRAADLLDAAAPADPLQRASADLVIAKSLVSRHLMTDPRALESATRALELTEANTPPDDVRRGEAQYVLAWTLASMGRTEGVLEHARVALEIQRRALGDVAEPAAVTMRLIGLHFERLGAGDSARAYYLGAIDIRERLNAPRDGTIAGLHIDLSRLEDNRGNLAEARRQNDAALHETESRLGPDDPAMVQAWRRYSALEWSAGDYSRAADYGQRALDLALADPHVDPYDLAVVRATLAWALYSLEDHARSLKLLRAAVPVFAARLGATHPLTVHYRSVLIELMPVVGDAAGAVKESRALCEALEADSTYADPETLADLLGSQADLIVEKDPAAALALCERAVATARRRPPAAPLVLLQARTVELVARARLKDWKGFDPIVREIQAVLDSSTTRPGATMVWTLERWADAEDRRGNTTEAFRLALDASRQSRMVLLRNVRSLPDREGLRFSAGRCPPLLQLLGLVNDASRERSVSAWDELVRWRGAVGAEIRERRAPRGPGMDSTTAAAHSQWIRAQSRLAQMETRLAAGASVAGGEATIDSLQLEAANAEREWAKVAPRGLNGTTEHVGFAEVRAALGANDALVSFTLTHRRDDPARILALVTRGGAADSSVRSLDLGPAAAIESAVQRWRATLGRSPRGDPGAERACRAEGAKVRALTWDVIAPALRGAADVYLVPEGPLHEIPWGALPEGGRGYLVERAPTVHVLDAERDLLDRGASAEEAGRGLLALGGIDFDEVGASRSSPAAAAPSAPVASSSAPVASRSAPVVSRSVPGCAGDSIPALPPLPGTEREVRAIQEERKDVEILTGGEATEAAFKGRAAGHAILHLATHGIVLADDCEAPVPMSRGVGGVAPLKDGKAADAAAAADEASRVEQATSPWLGRRAFLALAGANRARQHVQDENEGLLTAEEVSTLDLRGTSCVVLSACRSGVAESWETEGVLGMRRAFRLAGARSVIASQWDVDDDATRAWMTALYAPGDALCGAAGGSVTAAAAVQRASRKILEARRASGQSTHPFYWAAFTSSGE